MRVLVLFAHPVLERSHVNVRLAEAARGVEGVTVRDLYEEYPTLDIDVPREQALLVEHDAIVFQHPFYWYSAPALVKEWQDLVLEYGWAYGPEGRALEGKITFNAITTGAGEGAYSRQGHNRFTVRELLRPFEATAHLCRMTYLPPFVVSGSLRLDTEADVRPHAERYRRLLGALVAGAVDIARGRDADVLDIESWEPRR